MMGNYIVSARKYRPKGFEEVVGQDHITTTLKNAIQQDQLAQALLFCGPRGVGKTTCARILANMINDFKPEADQGSTTAMNIYELDAASNNSVDDIRNLIDQVRYPPQYGRYKVYIIDEVHMLSNQAFNAFLKTLEEPPSYAIFILATTEKHKVIPTILSRCQIFDFNRIEITDISDRLALIAEKEGIEAETEALHLIAQKADGALRDAMSLFDLTVTYSSGNKVTYKDTAKNLHILDYDYYFDMTDAFVQEDMSAALMLFNDILKKGFDGQNFINGLSEHFRDLLVCKDPVTHELLNVSDNIKLKYKEQAAITPKGLLLSALSIANQCDLNYKASKNQRLHVELSLMKMVHLKSAVKLADLTNDEKDLKKKRLTKPKFTEEDRQDKPAIQSTAEHADKPPSKPLSPNLKKTAKIPSFSDLVNQVSEVKEEPAKKLEEPADEMINKDPLEEGSLSKLWKEYGEKLKDLAKDNESNFMRKSFRIIDDNTIQVEINNSVEEDILQRFKTDFILFLKKNLNNDHIKIETVLSREETSEKIYTNTDKFNYLAKKNPVILKLKNTFGLDTEF